MTSSLVGSEMCIRDRKLAGSSNCAGIPHKMTPSLPGSRAHIVAADPVSYTHLTLPTICSV
eukprot:1858256-Prorocentrum_lima.AAC.1